MPLQQDGQMSGEVVSLSFSFQLARVHVHLHGGVFEPCAASDLKTADLSA